MGLCKIRAIEAAITLNQMLTAAPDLVNRVLGRESPLSDFLDIFETKILPERGLSKVTLTDYRQKLKHIRISFGSKPANEIHTLDVAKFLDNFPPTQSNRYRSLLVMIFRHAIARGLTHANPADATIARPEKVSRQRLTLESYEAIYQQAPQHIRNAMDLALQTLQRREDVAQFKFSDIFDGFLHIVQQKTKVALKIKIHSPLQTIIDRCRDDVLSPYLVHQPILTNKIRRSKKLSPESLSRGFQRARDKSGYFGKMAAKELPSFHEIRALGAKLYRDAGINPQNLLGHTTEKMTQEYLQRHELQWVEVTAGLAL